MLVSERLLFVYYSTQLLARLLPWNFTNAFPKLCIAFVSMKMCIWMDAVTFDSPPSFFPHHIFPPPAPVPRPYASPFPKSVPSRGNSPDATRRKFVHFWQGKCLGYSGLPGEIEKWTTYVYPSLQKKALMKEQHQIMPYLLVNINMLSVSIVLCFIYIRICYQHLIEPPFLSIFGPGETESFATFRFEKSKIDFLTFPLVQQDKQLFVDVRCL